MKNNSSVWLQKFEDNDLNEEIKHGDINKYNKTNLLNFGTAGIRGLMGAGFDKINEVTVTMAAQAFADFLIKTNTRKSLSKGIVIAFDNRKNSMLFRDLVSRVMKDKGIKVYSTNEPLATPLLSFLIRKLGSIGGVNITASHNPKEYNGFKVYNKIGQQFSSDDTDIIATLMKENDYCIPPHIKGESYNIVDKKLIDEYTNAISSKITEKFSDFSVSYSPLHGTGVGIAAKIFKTSGVKYFLDKNQSFYSDSFERAKSVNPEEKGAYDGALKVARKNKTDLAIVTDPDADRVGVVSKYKRRYKYITGNQLAVLYLDYLVSNKKIKKNSYIVRSNVSSSLVDKIAKKHGIEVIVTNVGFKNISDVIEKNPSNFLFAFEESYGMLIDKKISRDKDGFQGVAASINIAARLKKDGKTMFSRLKEIWDQYGIHRNIQISKKIDKPQIKNIVKALSKTKKIADVQVKKFTNLSKPADGIFMHKLEMENGSSIILRPSGTEPKIKIYFENIGEVGQDLIDFTHREVAVQNFIDDNSETFEDKKFSWKVALKYVAFIGIIIGIFVIVFEIIYKENANGNIWTNAKELFNSIENYKWLISILSGIAMGTLAAWMRKRLIEFSGQKVKTRHLIISSYMGSIISYITPFTIGGDAIGYWYLRRKGFKRGPLLASFLMSTVLFQISIILQSLIFVPVGMPVYRLIFNSGDPQSHAAFIMFLINVSWDVFATIMIISLVIWRRFQESIVRTSTKLLEWLSFIRIHDPGAASASYQYDLREMRKGFRKFWNQKFILFEALSYELLPRFLMLHALFNMWFGITNDNLPLGAYWTQVIATDLASTANSMSITPGGSGTSEWLNITINQYIYKSNFIGPSSSGRDLAISLDIVYKFLYIWPELLVSSLLILTIVVGEQRKNKHSRINKINRIYGKKSADSKTRYYKLISVPWIIGIVGWATTILLI